VHINFGFPTLFVIDLKVRTGQTDEQRDRRTDGRTDRQPKRVMQPVGRAHNDSIKVLFYQHSLLQKLTLILAV